MSTNKKEKYFILEWYEREIEYDPHRTSFSVVLSEIIFFDTHKNEVLFRMRVCTNTPTSGQSYDIGISLKEAQELVANTQHPIFNDEMTNMVKIKYGMGYYKVMDDIYRLSQEIKFLEGLVNRVTKDSDDEITIRKQQ